MRAVALPSLAIFSLLVLFERTHAYGIGGHWAPPPAPTPSPVTGPQSVTPSIDIFGGIFGSFSNPTFPSFPVETTIPYFPDLFTNNPPFPTFPSGPVPTARTTEPPFYDTTAIGYIPIVVNSPTTPRPFNPVTVNTFPPPTRPSIIFPTQPVFPLPSPSPPPGPPFPTRFGPPLPEPTHGPDYPAYSGGYGGSNYAFHNQPSYGGKPMSPQDGGSAMEKVNMLSTYLTEFLMTLSKEQLIAFFRVFYMSQAMGTSLLDPRAPLPRSLPQHDRQAVETARSIPLSGNRLQALEVTELGQIIRNYANKIASAPRAQKGHFIKEYHTAVSMLRIPKGIKYALKQAVL